MANQEVVNAINETMVPNGVKAINADSVRNLLLLMAEKMGEGTGSGAVKVHISAGQELDFSQVNFEDVGPFTPEEVELIKNMLAKAQQDNKAAYKLLNEHREQGIADLVMGDESLFATVTLIGAVRFYNEIVNQLNPELNVDWSAFSFNGVASCPMFYMNGKSDTSGINADSLALLYDLFGDMLLDIEDSMLNGIVLSYESIGTPYYVLKEDGSVSYYEDTPTAEYEPHIYVPGDGVELTEDQIEANKKAYDNLPYQSTVGRYWRIEEIYLKGSAEKGGCLHEAFKTINDATSFSLGLFWKGKDMWEVKVYEDGTATLEVYASINPTAPE